MTNKQFNKNRVIISFLWKFLEQGGVQGIQFIIQIILARLLSPNDYGVISLTVIFISIARVFVQSGFAVSLIQKKEIDDIDCSSVLFVSFGIAGFFYSLLYLLAPVIANYFDSASFTSVLRVICLTLFPGAINSVLNALISRKMLFKRLFLCSLSAGIASGVVSIILAYRGYGVWALVFQQIISQVLLTAMLFYAVRWKPHFIFSTSRLMLLFSFGWKILLSGLLDTIYRDSRSFLIGKIYSPSMLGYFHRGQQFPQFLISNITASIQSVLLPTLASQQDYPDRVKAMMRRSIITSSFIVIPMMIGLAVIAKPLVELLLTEKWLPAVPFLQIYCLSYMLWPIHTANLQAINALGRSDLFLKLEIEKKIFGFMILLLSLPFGVYYLAIGEIVSGIIFSFINAHPNKKLLNYGYGEQMKDILPPLLLSLVMGVVVYLILYLGLSPIFTMVVQILVGVIIYLGLAFVFKLECFTYLVQTVLSLFKTERNTQTK